MSFDNQKSTMPKKKAQMKTVMRTMTVPAMASLFEGQVTFFSSTLASLKNCFTTSILPTVTFPPASQKMAGQEGFEPPTPGFGVRCSANWSYWPARTSALSSAVPLFPALHVFCVPATPVAELLQLEPRRAPLDALAGAVVPRFALRALERNELPRRTSLLSHVSSPSQNALSAVSYSITWATTPAPTVRPPSRMANFSSFSMAIGVISSISIAALSPGMHMSLSRSFAVPVTSVVRK